jgi:hypothetical protein
MDRNARRTPMHLNIHQLSSAHRRDQAALDSSVDGIAAPWKPRRLKGELLPWRIDPPDFQRVGG